MSATSCHLPKAPAESPCRPNRLFLSSKHQNALTYLEYGLMERMGTILLTGVPGLGKTSLVHHLVHSIDAKVNVAEFSSPIPEDADLLPLVLRKFGLEPENGSRSKNLERLFQFLWQEDRQGNRSVLFLDEVQQQAPQVLNEIQSLSNLQADKGPLLQIILVGSSEFHTRLLNGSLAPLAEKIAVSYEMTPFSTKETADYIQFCIPADPGAPLFTPDALDRIHEHSGGIPVNINRLCEAVLLYAGMVAADLIDAGMVEKALAGQEDPPAAANPDGETPAAEKTPPAGGTPPLQPAAPVLPTGGRFRRGSAVKNSPEHKDFLIRNLHKQLFLERQRYSELLIKYSRLKQQYEAIRLGG